MEYRIGPLEARLLFTLEREGIAIFTTAQATELLGVKEGSVRRVLQRLTLKGRIQRVKKGEYHLVPSRAGYQPRWTEHIFTILEGILDEYYVGYWTALNYWGFTEQIPHTIFVATIKRHRPLSYGGNDVKYVTITPKKFFGWTREPIGETTFRVSDKEKTIIDSLDLPQHSGGIKEAVKGFSEDLDYVKLERYAEKIGNGAVCKRLGYLMEVLSPDKHTQIVNQMQESLSASYSWLDPTAPKKVLAVNARWRLYINLTLDVLRGVEP